MPEQDRLSDDDRLKQFADGYANRPTTEELMSILDRLNGKGEPIRPANAAHLLAEVVRLRGENAELEAFKANHLPTEPAPSVLSPPMEIVNEKKKT